MRREAFAVTACLAGLIVTAGCGGSHSGDNVSTGALPTTDQLRSTIQHAEGTQRSVVTTSVSTGIQEGASPVTCKVQLVPTKASDCTIATKRYTIRIITLPGATYTDDSTDAGPAGKPWRKAPGTDNLQKVMHDAAHDPALQRGVSTVAARVPETIDGKALHRYDLTIDAAAFQQAMTKHGGLGSAMPTITEANGRIWLGEGDLIAKQEIKFTMKDHPAVTETVTYNDWNAPLDIQAPPADRIRPSS